MAEQPLPDELDEQLEIAAGRRAPYTQLGDWVALSGATDHAKALYWHLSMHLNQRRGDFEVWPTRETLAEWMGFSRSQSVDRYVDELVALEAVEVFERRYGTGMRRRNVYVVHQEPPEDYAGPRSLKEFYATRVRREVRSEVRRDPGQFSIEFGKESGSEFGKSPGHTVVRSSAPPAKFGKSPGHTVVRSTAPRDVRSTAPRDVRSTAPRDVRSTAHKPDEVKPDELPTSPQPPSASSPCDLGKALEEGEGVAHTPDDNDQAAEVWAMLQAIPLPTDKRRPGRRSRKLQEVVDRCATILGRRERYGLTLAELQRHLSVDLNTVTHSIVGCWLYRLSDDQLPFPGIETPESNEQPRERQLPACNRCGARAGDEAGVRMIDTDGRVKRCSCHPHYKAPQTV